MGDERDARLREAGAVDRGCVIQCVAHDKVIGAGQRRQQPHVRRVAAREDEAGRQAYQVRRDLLELDVVSTFAGHES